MKRAAEFAADNVELVVVGGYAVAFHARPRATKDIAILLRGTAANLERASHALARFGAPANVVDAVKALGESDVVYLGQPPLRIDILRRIDGVDDSVFDRAVSTTWNGTTVSVIGLDDLIANKRAAARPQDLVDAELLERVRAVAAAEDERD